MSNRDDESDDENYDLEKNTGVNFDSTNGLLHQLEAAKNDFFSKQKKNIFFKSKQKSEYADNVCANFDLNDLLCHTMYVIPNTNKVYLNYVLFKQYANENNRERIVSFFVDLLRKTILEHTMIEFHLNMNTLSISATERYRKIVEMFAQCCLRDVTSFSKSISIIYIYYTPHMIETILKFIQPFMDPTLVKKIVKYSKSESENKLCELTVT